VENEDFLCERMEKSSFRRWKWKKVFTFDLKIKALCVSMFLFFSVLLSAIVGHEKL
jgi:hypothetical protein